jgi:hypothetical protein
MQETDYEVVFEEAERLLGPDGEGSLQDVSEMSADEMGEVEEIAQFVAELNDPPVSTYTTV